MSGKTLNQLILVELCHECEQNGIVSSGTKADLEVQLCEYLMDNGIDPRNALIYTLEPSDRLGVSLDGTHGNDDGDNREDAVRPEDRKSPTLESPNVSTQPSSEMWLSTLELSIRSYFHDQRQVAETMRRIEFGMHPPTQSPTDHTSRTHSHTCGF